MKTQKDKINEIREQIDQLDEQIVKLLSERLTAVAKIGQLKQEGNLRIEDDQRESFLQEQLTELAKKFNIDVSFIKRIWNEILEESYRTQRGVSRNE